jgi:hypothetical protein
VSGFFSLLPDIDLRKSKVSQIAYAAVLIAAVAFAIYYGQQSLASSAYLFAAFLVAFGLLDLLLRPRHRTITHTLLFGGAMTLAVLIVSGVFFAAAAGLGYLTHLAADNSLRFS